MNGQASLAGPEMTWVVAEHTATSNGELSVTKGQQVEVVEPWQARSDWWIVRAPGEPPQEGAVPAYILKPQPQHHPQQKTSPSRRPLSQPCDEALANNGPIVGNQSPWPLIRELGTAPNYAGWAMAREGRTIHGQADPRSGAPLSCLTERSDDTFA
ncbi:unnamed protein product, partial [Iphiclides podalirius]